MAWWLRTGCCHCSSWVTAVVQAGSLAWEILPAVGETKKKKKKCNIMGDILWTAWQIHEVNMEK